MQIAFFTTVITAALAVAIAWTGAAARIAAGVAIAAAVVVVGVTSAVDDLIVVAAMAGATTNSDVFLFSFIFSKTQYSTDVVCKACEPVGFLVVTC